MSVACLKKSCRGMTLVEILLVTAILSIVMMAVMSLYIPTQRSTVVQSQLTDVQGNLQLAMNRLSEDLLTAGFLVPSGVPPITGNSSTELMIQTRLVSKGFGRIFADAENQGGDVKVTLASNAMAEHFPVGSLVRLVEGVSATEINESTVPDPTERVYTVVSRPTANTLVISDPAGNLTFGAVRKETVVVRVKDSGTPSVQTIRYRVNNGALERIVNGETQYLARNITSIGFIYALNAQGKVRKVEVTLTGKTRAMGTEATAIEKTRTLQTSVTLRNVT